LSDGIALGPDNVVGCWTVILAQYFRNPLENLNLLRFTYIMTSSITVKKNFVFTSIPLLYSLSTSEVRLVEVLDTVCSKSDYDVSDISSS